MDDHSTNGEYNYIGDTLWGETLLLFVLDLSAFLFGKQGASIFYNCHQNHYN